MSCCESCERRRSSFLYDSKAESDDDSCAGDGDDETDDEEKCFECTETSKEHIHDVGGPHL